MNKINWINGQAGGTPLSAENLNQMQDNIEEAIDEETQRHIITAYPTTVLTDITSQDQTVILDKSIIVGNKLTVENNTIKVGANVSHVLITAQIYYQDYSDAVRYLYPNIQINNVKKGRAVCSRAESETAYQTVQIPAFIIEVRENDVIKLTTGEIASTNQGKYRGNQDGILHTYITVEVIE